MIKTHKHISTPIKQS